MVVARPNLLLLLITLLLSHIQPQLCSGLKVSPRYDPFALIIRSKATRIKFKVQNLRSDRPLGEGDSFVEICPMSDTEEDQAGHVRNDRKKEQ